MARDFPIPLAMIMISEADVMVLIPTVKAYLGT
jgi:hypothetical protein